MCKFAHLFVESTPQGSQLKERDEYIICLKENAKGIKQYMKKLMSDFICSVRRKDDNVRS